MKLDHLPLSKAVAAVIEALSYTDYPRDGITSHHGVSVGWRGFDLGFSAGHRADFKWLLVTCYDSSKGHRESEHKRNARCIARGARARVVDLWNGDDRCSGVSVMVNRPVPPSLATAMKNYRELPSPFNVPRSVERRFRAFDRWWENVSN